MTEYTGNHRFVSNAGQARGRCGHYVEVLYIGESVDRVRCNACNEKQALWRTGNRVHEQVVDIGKRNTKRSRA